MTLMTSHARSPLSRSKLFMTGVYYMVISTFLINTCVQAALLLVGTSLIEHGKLTPEVLLAFMLYQGQLQVRFKTPS
jgi:ATP-binding cassette subfamily B (MDR/TAP) protein 9